jgi:hypothetical protein
MTPLSILQKREIAQLARRAYDAWSEREAFEAINSGQSRTACFEAWRHVEQGKACGVQSLCACTQAHYGRLVAHFQALGGNAAAATRTLVRDADNDRRIARYKLDQALQERGLREEYAAAICRRQYRCGLDEANTKQLWRLVFTIRNRRKRAAPEAVTEGNPF